MSDSNFQRISTLERENQFLINEDKSFKEKNESLFKGDNFIDTRPYFKPLDLPNFTSDKNKGKNEAPRDPRIDQVNPQEDRDVRSSATTTSISANRCHGMQQYSQSMNGSEDKWEFPRAARKPFPVQDRVIPITTTNRFSTLARMADCESHENGIENLQSEENLRVPRERNASFQPHRFGNQAPILNHLNRKNDQVSVSQENHQMQSDDPRRIQGDTARNFRNRQGMVSEDAQRFSFSRDRRTEPEMTTFGTATKRQRTGLSISLETLC